RVLDEFGLIVCGWSGAWDTALRDAIARCPNRRYTTFWATIGKPHRLAQDLITKRAARVIRIESADAFFNGLAERITALEEVDRPHPLTAQMAAAMLKRYLAEDRHRIRLHDLVMGEVSAASSRTRTDEFSLHANSSDEEFRRRVAAYEAATEILRKLAVTGAYWSRQETDRLWIEVVRRLTLARHGVAGVGTWIELQSYPATLTLYAAGLGALAAGNFRLVNDLLTCLVANGHEREIAAARLLPFALEIQRERWWCLPDLERRHTPLNDHLLDLLRPELAELIPTDQELEEAFDRFELLAGLVHLHHAAGERDPDPEQCWLPVGRFAWRLTRSYYGESLMSWLANAEQQREEWPPLRAGMFGGSYARFAVLNHAFVSFMGRIRSRFW
ncbi:MAG: hypothetical protein M3N07_06940, partial [Pseudomonadota bacterium]|nr:hypothetical protein [Pseudomonadota bacterium]